MAPTKRKWIQAALTILVLVIGSIGMYALKESRSEVQHKKPPPPLPLVRIVDVAFAPRSVSVTGHGTVLPLREISLVPQVAGKVVEISPALVDGGAFQKGDPLLQIDPQDYKIAVTLAKARLKDAESKFVQAREESAAAREEWAQLNGDNAPPPLVAKEPQLDAASAQLDASRAELTKAELQLNRTRIRAPFDGRVAEKEVDIGQYVTTGQKLAVLYATQAAEIVVPLPTEDLAWFDVPGFTNGNGAGADAVVEANIAGETKQWPGRIVRSEGKLDQRTRMVNVVVRIDNPYATRPPLAVGLFAKVTIRGRSLDKAALIPRAALRDNDQVWVVDPKGRLTFRTVTVARLGFDGAIIGNGLKHGEQIVVSTLKGVSDGMRVRPVASTR
ncbi:MAG: efflux RND transporter periplasmic adaptor subunit [Desulfobacteraceae bacterium]|jgi:RND family efflux transporter MFP subunit